MPTFLVETYAPVPSTIEGLAERARFAGEGGRVRYVRSIFVPEDEICFHLFEGPSADAVGEASRRAALSVERIVEALQEEDS